MPRSLALAVSAAAVTLCGCPDQGVTAINARPEVTITSHADGDVLLQGETVNFSGIASDPDHQAQDLLATWRLGGAEICPATAPSSDGLISCQATVDLDDTSLTLEVVDPQGAAGAAVLTLEITPTDAPVVSIASPEPSGVYYSDQLISFEGLVSDAEDEPAQLEVWWESSLEGQLSVAAVPTSSGEVLGSGYLGEGEHAIALHALDSTDKTGSDSVVITVGPPNSAPSCGITTPETGGAGDQGALVTFEASVADDDVPADWLEVTWSSDKDGEIGQSTPNTDGSVTFPYGDLSVNTHVVSVTVNDEVGATCTDSVLYTVGTPPSVAISAPSGGEVYNDGDSVTFTAQVSDSEDSPTALALSWTTDLDGEISTQGADSSGLAQFTSRSLSAGEHALTLRATDTAGLYSTALVTFTVNALPSAPSVSISPDPAFTDDGLVAHASGSADPDTSGTVTYSYAWYEAGVLSSASSSASFPASATTKGLSYRVVVTPSDGTGDGDPGEAEIEIDNSAPVLSGPTISPATGITNSSTLVCSASATDADGDAPSVTYAWDNGGAGLGSGASLTLTAGSASPGDGITCTAIATDDEGATGSASASVVVDNSAPVVDSVTISPSSGLTTSGTAVCSASASDPDGDATVLSYAWSIGSTSLGSGASLTLGASTAAPGDSLTCTATATDTGGATGSASASVTVANSDPTVTSVTISPSSGVTTSSTLGCSASATDPDGGSPSFGYSWSNGGFSLGSGASLVLDPSTVSPGDSVTCTATATDAHGGSGSGASSVTVLNSAPSVSAVSITPDPAFAADSLACAASGYVDPDGDADVSTLAWTVNGSAAGSGSSPGLGFIGGDTVTCTVTPFDGVDAGTPVAGSIVISNSPPVLDEVTLAPDPAYEGDTLLCAPGSYADDDGDSASFSYVWDVAGVDPGIHTSTLSSSWFDRDESVVCGVTPSDGSDAGDMVASNRITISNSPPSIASVGISPASPTAGDTLSCAYSGYSDADGDPDASTLAWTVNGGAAGSGSSPSLTLVAGDVVVCTVTPHDGDDAGSPLSDSVTLANQPPELDSVVLSPGAPTTDQTVLATVTSHDDDGDTVTVSYAWYVEGDLVGATGSSLDGASWFDKDDEVYVVATPNDGSQDGAPVSSSSVIVANTPPGAPSVSIDPSAASAGVDDLVCQVDVESYDADGDTITYSMSWTVDGLAYTAGGGDTGDTGAWLGPDTDTWTDDTVPAEDTQDGEAWVCTVTPHDGDDAGATAQASATTSSAAWSGVIEMPATGTVDGFSAGYWSALNGDGRVATRIVLTQACANPILALYQHASADTSIHGSYYVMDSAGTVLDASTFDYYSGCHDCWLPHASRLSVTMDASTTYYLGFQNGTGLGDMSGPSIYLDATARTVGIATFDDPRADKPGADIRGLASTTVGWQNRWRVDCE